MKKGDYVEIVRSGLMYPSYCAMAVKLKAKYWVEENYKSGSVEEYNGLKGVVVALSESDRIALVRLDGRLKEILIGLEGLKTISKITSRGAIDVTARRR